jgi:tetratricopeptide (TPR) repeat protein
LVFYLARQYDQALEICQKILEMDSTGFYQGYFVVGRAYERKGMYAEAIQALETAVRLSHRNPHMLAVLGHVLANSGKRAEAVQLIDELQGRLTRVYTAPFNIAMIYAGLGQKDETLEWLEKAYEDRSMWMIFVNAYPIFDFLRPDPRFQDLVRRMGFSS